jgi:1-deoxy-D-xylulose-5-phosphate synthase
MSILDQINSPDELKKLSIADLKKLAIEIRQELININKDHSIHLSSNLGIVEIAIGALLSFNVPTDKVFYDIGHQSYPHKLLTGRKDIVKRIRQDKGSSGFQSMQESIYDVYSTGHAGNSLSIAHGLQMQNQIDNKYGTYVVPIIGDGGIANGEAFEALNNIKADNARVIIILNDNGMSISKSVGALAKVLAKVKNSKLFFASERTAKRILAGKRPTSRPFQ